MQIQYLLMLLSFLFPGKAPQNTDLPASIYDFKVAALDGGTIDFADFKGKKILIVNTASKCGFTKQYEGLEALSKEMTDKLVIIGFPANNFGEQEPGANEEIAAFCKRNFGVTFPLAAKISVAGPDMAPIYQWLTQEQHNHKMDSKVKWNFQKYLIDETGNLVAMYPSSTKPEDADFRAALVQP